MTLAQQPSEDGEIALDGHIGLLAADAECKKAIEFWTNRREEVRAELAAIMGDATVGTLDGRPILFYEKKNAFRTAEFAKVYPDMAKLYTREVTKTTFDVEWFKMTRPELYEEFKVRSMRSTFEG